MILPVAKETSAHVRRIRVYGQVGAQESEDNRVEIKVYCIKLKHLISISGGGHRGVAVIVLLLSKMIKQVFSLAELVNPYVAQGLETRARTAGTPNRTWME